ncbi:MAG: carboxypeptidase-like regulatory domain-containing protein, partial [Gemmatimonadota bacterium]|nr:carboxypeptidase-like regulatory domain-containing protein [Gemmatimonadota bacterium]
MPTGRWFTLHHLMALGLSCVLGALMAPPAAAQIGMGTDIITGRITTADGTPVARVEIAAYSLETQVTRRARTDERGQFTILFTDGGGQYQLTARAIGFQPAQETVYRHADEDRLLWNAQLTPGAMTMEPITVQARRGPTPVQNPDRPTPGSVERALNPELVARLPIDATDLNLLATLVPGIVGVDATDSTAAAFSVAGLAPDANALTLDGLIFGSGSVPQDALRQTRVVTSTYDVARGQFSGGLIASTTRSGSNMLQGSSQYTLRDDDLALSGEEGSAYTQGFTQHQLSAGLGGPIVRDRLFVFGSAQARLRTDAQQTILTATTDDYYRLGVHPDSVARFLSIVDSLGVPRVAPADGGRSSDNLSALVRLDFLASNAHTLTLRGDWRGTGSDPARLGPLAMPDAGGTVETSGGGGMLTVSSRFGMRILNDARVYVQGDRRDGDPFLLMPQGRVQVASSLEDSSTGVSTLVFGGNPGLPTANRTTRIEASDEVSWLAGRGHRPKLGGLFVSLRQSDTPGGNQFGTFT